MSVDARAQRLSHDTSFLYAQIPARRHSFTHSNVGAGSKRTRRRNRVEWMTVHETLELAQIVRAIHTDGLAVQTL